MEVVSYWESPAETVTVVTWSDGLTQVVSDQDFATGDWQAACAELGRLLTGPLGQPVYEGEHLIWATAGRLPVAA
jgi:hypothetical protein